MLIRRDVVKGLCAGLPLAAILGDPTLARAAAAGLETVSLTTQGGRAVSAALALPAAAKAPALVLIHEWWGLNDQIKAVAAEFAKEGFVALAVDMYGGKVGTDPDSAKALMASVDAAGGTDILTAWISWLKAHARSSGKVGTVGWCFGGGWSLAASAATPVDATVVYYGRVNRAADELKGLKGPVLGHFATLDKNINKDMVAGYETAMTAAGKAFTTHWYEADHAFANPTGQRYDKEDAQLSWTRTLEFLKAQLA